MRQISRASPNPTRTKGGDIPQISKGYVVTLQSLLYKVLNPKAWALFEYARPPKSRMLVEDARSPKLGYARPRKADAS